MINVQPQLSFIRQLSTVESPKVIDRLAHFMLKFYIRLKGKSLNRVAIVFAAKVD